MLELFFKSNKNNLMMSFLTSLVWLFIVIGWISDNLQDGLMIIGFWTVACVTVYGLWFGCWSVKELVNSLKEKSKKKN